MKGILFKPDVWKAKLKVLEQYREAQTRRVIKPQPDADGGIDGCNTIYDHNIKEFARYKVGEVVYIKEAWGADDDGQLVIFYKSETPDWGGKWHSPMFLPAKFARDFIQITDVKAQRLQEITEEDAKAEGVEPLNHFANTNIGCHYRESYIELWDSINKKYPWSSNPWIWRYEFKKVERPVSE